MNTDRLNRNKRTDSNKQTDKQLVEQADYSLIHNKTKFFKAVGLLILGWIFALNMAGFLSYIFLSMFTLIFWLVGSVLLAKSIDTSGYKTPINILRFILVWLPIVCIPFIFSYQLLLTIFFTLMLSLALKSRKKKHRKRRINKSHDFVRNRKSKKQNSKRDISTQAYQQSQQTYHNNFSVESDAAYLNQLLSKSSQLLLRQVINTMNHLLPQVDYLQKDHSYLASTVSALVDDLQHNTLIRLDSLAKNFIESSGMNNQAKAIFSNNYEQQVTALLEKNLQELESLNQSIIDKQLSGFSNIDQEDERKFRSTIMDLKILLKCCIAQTPENNASSHAVILAKLESSTLKQMSEAFFQPEISQQQKQTLQAQLEDMIKHFKVHAGQDFSEIQIQVDKQPLTLGYDPDQPIQSEKIQSFIDFNEQYVKQLKQHWK